MEHMYLGPLPHKNPIITAGKKGLKIKGINPRIHWIERRKTKFWQLNNEQISADSLMSPEKSESLVSSGKAKKQPNLHSRIPRSKHTGRLGVPLKMGSSGNANHRTLVANLLEADSQCLSTAPVRWLSFDHLCRRLEVSFKEKIKQRGLWTEEPQSELRGGHYAGNTGKRAGICERLHAELETPSLLSRMPLPTSILPGQQIWKTSPVTPPGQRGKGLKTLTLKVLQGYAGRLLLGPVWGRSGPMCCAVLSRWVLSDSLRPRGL